MKKLILISLAVVINANCNIEYYKMMTNRDSIKELKHELNSGKFKKCVAKGDCIVSIKSLKELDIELTKKYHNCKNK